MLIVHSLLMYTHLQDHQQAAMLTTRNVKFKPQPGTPLLRNLSSLNLVENGTAKWIIFT